MLNLTSTLLDHSSLACCVYMKGCPVYRPASHVPVWISALEYFDSTGELATNCNLGIGMGVTGKARKLMCKCRIHQVMDRGLCNLCKNSKAGGLKRYLAFRKYFLDHILA